MDVVYPWWPNSNTSAPIISSDGSDTIEVQSRIDSAACAFGANSISITKHWSKSQKCNLRISDVINLLIWVRKLVPNRKAVLQASPISRSMCQNYDSNMSHITLIAQSRMYQIPTREIETELGLDSMDKYIARRQLRWLGHVSRMPFDCLPRRLLFALFLASLEETKGCPGDDLR